MARLSKVVFVGGRDIKVPGILVAYNGILDLASGGRQEHVRVDYDEVHNIMHFRVKLDGGKIEEFDYKLGNDACYMWYWEDEDDKPKVVEPVTQPDADVTKEVKATQNKDAFGKPRGKSRVRTA